MSDDPVSRDTTSTLSLEKLQTLLELASAYETKVPAPVVRHCSHGSVLIFTPEQIEEINQHGTCSLAPFAMMELAEALAKRGN